MKLMQYIDRDESGATMVEYGIMIVAIAAVLIAVAFAIGVSTENAFETLNECLPDGTGC